MIDLKLPQYKLDFKRPIIGYGHFKRETPDFSSWKMVDDSIVEKKFNMWDYVRKENLLQHKDPTIRAKAAILLRDKSILAYDQLSYDGQPIKLYGLQDAILSDTHKWKIFCGANQMLGKSFSLNVDAATSFLQPVEYNWIGIIVSGSLPQSQFQMDRIKNILKSARISYTEEDTTQTKTGKKDNSTQISYTYYAKDGKTPLYRKLLICCPHTSSALGYPANQLWLDEFEWWENCDQHRFLYQIAIPRTFRTGGGISIFSNPNGREGLMYELWNERDEEGNCPWHRYQFNYWDAKGATEEGFKKFSRGMTRAQVESTLLAVFTRSEGSFFSQEEIDNMLCPELSQKGDQAGYGRDCAFFLDVGAVHDQSCLIGGYLEPNAETPDIPLIKAFYVHKYPVGYPIARVVGLDIDHDDGWSADADFNPSVREVLNEYSSEFHGKLIQPLFGFDATGNAGMLPLLQSMGIDAVDVTFSGKLKWHMYQRYQYYVQQQYLKRAKERDDNTIRGCDFNYQASRLVVKKGTMTVYKQIHHEKEDDLDDTQDAMAGLIHLIENPNLPSLSFDVIDSDGKSLIREDGSYVPSWMDKTELEKFEEQKEAGVSWMERRRLLEEEEGLR